MQATASQIEREVRIEASPEIVFSYFVDPQKIVKWMSRAAEIDARPGGKFLLDYNGFDRASGEIIELVPHSRIVFSWGWATLGSQMAPGTSRLEFTLTADGSGTIVRMVHSGLEGLDAQNHAEGWDMFLPFLAQAVQTGTSGNEPAPVLSQSEDYASRLNAALCEFRYLLESLDDRVWSWVCPGSGWTVGATAAHAVSHTGLVGVVAEIAANRPSPIAGMTREMLDSGNAQAAAAKSGITRAEVLAELLRDGPPAVEMLKSIDPASLSNAQPLGVAGGAEVSAADLIEGPILGDLAAHLADIREAIS